MPKFYCLYKEHKFILFFTFFMSVGQSTEFFTYSSSKVFFTCSSLTAFFTHSSSTPFFTYSSSTAFFAYSSSTTYSTYSSTDIFTANSQISSVTEQLKVFPLARHITFQDNIVSPLRGAHHHHHGPSHNPHLLQVHLILARALGHSLLEDEEGIFHDTFNVFLTHLILLLPPPPTTVEGFFSITSVGAVSSIFTEIVNIIFTLAIRG